MSSKTAEQLSVEEIQELDRLYLKANQDKTEESWTRYREAFVRRREKLMLGFWKEAPKFEFPSTVRIYDVLTKDLDKQSVETLNEWKKTLLAVERSRDYLARRLGQISEILESREE